MKRKRWHVAQSTLTPRIDDSGLHQGDANAVVQGHDGDRKLLLARDLLQIRTARAPHGGDGLMAGTREQQSSDVAEGGN